MQITVIKIIVSFYATNKPIFRGTSGLLLLFGKLDRNMLGFLNLNILLSIVGVPFYLTFDFSRSKGFILKWLFVSFLLPCIQTALSFLHIKQPENQVLHTGYVKRVGPLLAV